MQLWAPLLLILLGAGLAAASDATVVSVCHISSGATQFRALSELPFHALHGDCLGRCPCTNCDVAPDPLWAPCANATNPTCVLAPCVRTLPPLLYLNCSQLACEECQSSGNCAFCFADAYGARGTCTNLTDIGSATCARTGATADLCRVAFPEDRIVPRAECFRPHVLDASARVVYWGYTSFFAETQTVPFNSSLNQISAPVLPDGVFAPGDGGWFFETLVGANETVEWTLLDTFATSAGLARECPACAGADDCTECQARTGCGWDGAACVSAVRDAAVPGYLVAGECPAAAECAARTDCQACAVGGCAWCVSTSRCVDANATCADSTRDPFQCAGGERVFVSDATRGLLERVLCRAALDVRRPDMEYLFLVLTAVLIVFSFLAGIVLWRTRV
jgi:hypothetical protein